MRLGLALAMVIATISATATTAAARAEKTLAYPRDQAWSTSLRFLVVDERVKVTDKDETAGYVLFDLKDDGKTFRGSLELFQVDQDGRKAVRFVAQIEDRPSWLETKMLERLEQKLRVELGSPSPPPSPKPKDPEPPKDPPRDGDPPRKDPPPRHKDPDPIDDGPPVSPTP
jgi:hypothetical protein